MPVSLVQALAIVLTVFGVIAYSIHRAGRIRSQEGFSVAGRRSGAAMVAGAIAGTSIGGGATIGTAQLAESIGLGAWWFTLGIGIGFLIQAALYAARIRSSSLETVPQYLVATYGRACGPIVSVVSCFGMFFAVIASVLPGVAMISAVTGLPPVLACVAMLAVMALYVFFGGIRGASIAGLVKSVLIWLGLALCGAVALDRLANLPPDAASALADPRLFDLLSRGWKATAADLASVLVGVLCAQTYIQAIFSAKDTRTAAIGCVAAAVITIPVGLPCVAIGLFMHAAHPDIAPILALPAFMLREVPQAIGGIALGAVILAVISSPSGQILAIGTMMSRDIAGGVFHVQEGRKLLFANRAVVLATAAAAALFAATHLESMILQWNILSMALRGAPIFLSLTAAVFLQGQFHRATCVASIVAAIIAATAATLLETASPVFAALAVSLAGMAAAWLVRRAGSSR